MKDETKTRATTAKWSETAPLLLLTVWVAVISCFFYYLVRAGIPGQ